MTTRKSWPSLARGGAEVNVPTGRGAPDGCPDASNGRTTVGNALPDCIPEATRNDEPFEAMTGNPLENGRGMLSRNVARSSNRIRDRGDATPIRFPFHPTQHPLRPVHPSAAMRGPSMNFPSREIRATNSVRWEIDGQKI